MQIYFVINFSHVHIFPGDFAIKELRTITLLILNFILTHRILQDYGAVNPPSLSQTKKAPF